MSLNDVGRETRGTLDPEADRWRDGLAVLAETAVPQEDCPEPDRIWAAVAGELPPDELREMVSHTAACVVCAEAWRLAVELEREATEDLEDEGSDERSQRTVFWRNWAQVAAMVVVLAGAAFLTHEGGPFSGNAPPPEVVRSGAGTRVVALTSPSELQPRDDLVLAWEWQPPAPELISHVEITWETAERSEPIFEARDLLVPRLRIPPESLARVPSGATLLWEVTATRDGKVVAQKSFPLRLE